MNSQWQTFLDAQPPAQCDDFTQLPSDFVSPLSSFSIITMQGEESEKYLQGQVTADIAELTNNHWSLAAHCDAKGKMWATYFVAKQSHSDLTLLTTKEAASKSLPELSKFSVFSQTEIIEKPELLSFYIHGPKALAALKKQLPSIDDDESLSNTFVNSETIQVIKLTDTRFIAIVASTAASEFIRDLEIALIHENAFFYHETLAARPYLYQATSSLYVPQMLNLQALQAISFTKGCYIGQETVARMRYLGKNKRATYLLRANNALPEVTAGDKIQRAMGENWRSAGVVLQSTADKHKTYFLAVLPNDITDADVLRIESALETTIDYQELPYSLDAE